MDAFDNPARDGMAGPQRDGVSTEQANQAVGGSELLAASASVTATASAITLAIQAILVPDASGRIVLPAGVSIDDITVSGTDLIITLPNGQVMIIPNGAIDIPSIVVDGDTVPASTVAQLLENLGDLNPEAGVRSSGGNFADPEGAIQDPYALGDLLPYTELAFPQPEDRELLPAIPEEEDPTVVIVTPDQPAGSVNATANVNEAGLPARGNESAGSNSAANSETVTGSILFNTPDGAGSVTLNGVAITAVGQVITTPIGQLTITSIAAGNIGYSYTLTDNTNANNNVTDVFAVVVTDRDGDAATADLTISIIDDAPIARPDTDTVAAGTFAPETGNVPVGTGTTSGAAGADTPGADGASLTGIRAGTTGTEFAAPGGVVQGQYGTLTIDAQGNYSYVRNVNTPGGVSDVFTYRLTDGDGDTSTATLTISIGDSPSVISFIRTDGPTSDVAESGLAPRAGEPAGSAFDGGSETATDTLTFVSPDGVGSVSINGVAVNPGALPQQIFADATGTLVINSYSYDPATGQGAINYTYTLNDNTLNNSGTNVTFDVVVTDLDGDAAEGDLTIRIIDDAPTAVNDVDSVTEDGGSGENPPTADGNVLTGVGGSDANGTDGAADVQGADGATVTAVTGGTVGQAFAAAYGTLTLNADGSYAYVLNNDAQPVQGLSVGETLTETFTYTITDGDGDTSTATLTITINGANDGVAINGLNVEGGEVTVDEDNLIDGSSPDAAALTQPGTFTVSTPDGLGNVTIGGTQVVTNGVFTAGTANSPLGVVNITGFTPVVGTDGSVIGGTFTYEYVLSDNTLTHPAQGEDNVTDSFAVVVTDSDGSTGNASLDVRIIDDVPAAANDADSVTEDDGNGDNPPTADGNVLTGAGGTDTNATDGAKDVQGADGATVTAVTGGTIGEGFPTTYGTLTLNSDGSYTYVLNNQAQPVQGLSAGETLTETFTYTITDGDGDTSPATLTITINGANDGVTIRGLDAEGSELRVDEDDLAARVGEAAGSDTTPDGVADSDSFSVATPDGMGTVVLDSFNGVPLGAPLTLVVGNGTFTPQSVTTAYGKLDITGFTPVTGQDGSVIGGTFTYTYTLTDNRTDHPAQGQDGLTDSVGVTVTDIDGSTASANIDIRITDDVPAAADDGVTQSLENQPVTINVLANDVQGADSVQPSAVELVADSLTGAGTLVYNDDGSFTYTPTAQETGEVSFQYQITDGDGDTSVATATITLVADSAPQFRNPANVVVDEDGLPGANADNGLAGEVTSTGLATANGSLTVDFGSDVPGTLAGSLVLNYGAGLDTQLTVNGVAVTFEKVGDDLVGSVAGNEVIRVALTTPTAGPGATQVTYGYTVTLSQAIDQAVAGSEDTDILSGIGFTVTDSDGTAAPGSFGVTIVDDIPTISNVAGGGSVTLDETSGFDTVTSATAVIAASLAYGADGAAATGAAVYGIELSGGGTSVASGIVTAVGDFAITLFETSSTTIVGRYTDGGGVVRDAFTVTINADGTLTVQQLVALEHLQDGGVALHNDALTLNGLISATVTIKDGDDDTATAKTEIGDQISFLDDGPSVTASASGAALVLNDESATSSVAATINTGAIVKGDDPNVGGTGAISTATSGTAVVTATPVYGADGAAASNALTYALAVTNATSGLTVTDGSAINLVLDGNVIVGQVSGGAFAGQAAFAIAINPTTGVVTVEQYLSLDHPNAANPDDMVQLLANTLGVVVTATDSDGDTATSGTIDISAQIRFDDDGPTISNVAGGGSVTLDETSGFDTVTSATAVIAASLAYGADGAAATGAAVYGIELSGGGTSVASGIVTAVGDFAITLFETSSTTIVGRYTDGGGVVRDAFTVTINADGTLTVQQLVALEHLQDGGVALHNDALTLNGLISATVTIKDGDDDTATAKTEIGDQISFLDDGPSANADTNSVIEGAVATGNVLTDNDDVFGADGAATTSPAGGVVGVRVAGGDTTTPVTTGTGSVISTARGDLTLNADGTYSYDAKPNTTSTVVTDTFVYTIRDADGDTSTTTLTITIQPVTLAPDNQTKTVDEAGLDLVADGNDVAAGTVVGSNPAATTETVTGALAVTGPGITYAPQTVEDALGKFVLNANGTYTYTLKSAFDGATLDNDITTENGVRVFNYTATDANGNSVGGTVTINIIDDVPTARADTDSVIEDTASVATGNVVTGVGTTNAPGSADTAGADGAAVSGVAAGTPAGDVTGNVGAAVAGSYGSLTLNASGGYTYTLNNGNATVQALGASESLTETFTYTLTDGDGDRTTTTLTITINGSNDLPTIGTATTAVSDEGLAGGFPDATGTVDTTNLTVRTGTIVATDPDGDPLTFSLGAPATALSSGGQPIVWDTTNPQLLLGKVGADTIISVAIDNGGNFTVSLLGPIDHPNTTLEDALSLVVPVNVNDGTTTVTNASALTIGLEDDSPIAIAPLNAQLLNAPGSSVYQSLDTDGDVDNNYGGDGPGSVIFTAATVAALQAQNLTSGSQALTYTISANGTVLTAEKPNGDDVFIIRLQPAGHADQYQVQMVQKLDSTVTVDFNDGGYDFVGGNTAWIGFVKPGDNDSQDVLITPMTNGADGGTMNANATNTGVSSGNSVGTNEAVRLDFVVDLTGSPGNNDYGPLANQNHAFDSHYTANGASALFSNIQTSSSVRLVARDDIDTDNDVGDGVQDTINKVAISFNGVTVFVTANGTYSVGGQSYTVSFSGGQATVTGVTADTRLAGFTADGYNSIEFHHAGGDTFKIGDFGAAVQTENPVNFNVPVTIVDGDGDTAQGSLAITTAAPLLVIGSATGDATGQTTDHVVANPQGSIDGVIQGGNFDDTLVGDPGSVTITEGQQANVVLVLDSSGSMTDQITFGGGSISRMQALKNGVNALIDSLSQSGAQDVRITVIDFDAAGTNLGTFNLIVNGVVQASQITLAKAAVNGMTASGGTNYEDGLQDALTWINGGLGIPGADVNKVVFVSDGNPTLWNNGGDGSEDSDNVQDAMNQILGTDGSNEPQQILATGYSIDAIGVNVNGTLLTRLGNVEDGNASGGTGSASNATSAEQLASILQNLGGSTDLAAAGNDVVNGGDGADVIFGDVLFTDALATELGVSLPAGSGWAVFQTLEGRPNAESLDPAGNGANWNRQDTIAYIRANHAILGQESGRTAGNDVINGGAGNDIIYGQEGNDTIDGGDGDDFINGGSGNGTITGGTGNDAIIASTGDGSIVNAGTGADTVTIKVAALTARNWTVDLGNGDGAADTIVFKHDAVNPANNTLVTVSSFNVVQDKIAIAVSGTSETDGSFLTVTAGQTDIGAGVEIIELVNNAWVTTSLGNDGDGSTIEGFIQAATDDIPNGTYTFIVYSNTSGTANAGIYSVTINDNTNPGNSGMTVEHIMTINGVGYGNLTAANFVGAADPIILDLNGDGYSFGPTAAFDINADGAADRVTWNSSNDGILAVDLDGNGKIDSGTEIFTPGFGGGNFANGVAALASLDDNGDGVVDANDAAFAKLLVWRDANADGVSDAGELSSLTDQGITSISTGAVATEEFIDGQAVTAHGSFTRADGSKGDYIEVQLDTQLGARGADREAEDAQRSAGNQALTASLVAASLVAMAQGAQAQTETEDKPVAHDLPTPLPVDDAAAHSASVVPAETAPIGGEDLSATKDAAPASTSTSSHSDDASAAPASIEDGQGNIASDDQGAADTNASDALFDMVSVHADSPMDGLLTLGLIAAGQAAAETADATVKGAAAEAVLAEVLKGGSVDHLIDAVVGGESQHAANDDAANVDLAQLLNVKVPADMGAFAHQSVEHDLHQAAPHV
ncbi:beta strand repeat-containing protein [Sphingopyxis witflariensis]|uniref:VWFA domain-containing protein n=1 Tax=Sphingopyxis witflariensis TaxID=173675 RepID=A0A246JJR3_9SPHN|nr:DUF5801 repeats-in-toxin domain-containing protein [Sphingopyxis witflariensis]OWQ92884.1 hypothetical protein CDQ91_17185 [Sphingopyxis witflariensis]